MKQAPISNNTTKTRRRFGPFLFVLRRNIGWIVRTPMTRSRRQHTTKHFLILSLSLSITRTRNSIQTEKEKEKGVGLAVAVNLAPRSSTFEYLYKLCITLTVCVCVCVRDSHSLGNEGGGGSFFEKTCYSTPPQLFSNSRTGCLYLL